MTETKVARRYAKSFIDLSREKNSFEEAHHDMAALLKICRQNRDFRLMLKNPLIQPDTKAAIIQSVFGKTFSKTSLAFVNIIVRKRREFYLEEIAAEFEAQYKEIRGITSALVITAAGIDDTLRNEIRNVVKNISKKEVALEEKVDASIIGGFILRFGDIQYDSSVARNLHQFRMNFSNNLYQSKIWKK